MRNVRASAREARSTVAQKPNVVEERIIGNRPTIRLLTANALENNLVLFQFVNGKRSPVKWIRNTPTATKQWHALKVRITGKKVEGFLDDKLLLEHELGEPVSGKIGVWSKADSVMYMDGYAVSPK